jgi:hypothetical protein
MKSSLVMLALIVASWIYASKQGWDGTWKPITSLVWMAVIVLYVFIMSAENGLVT